MVMSALGLAVSGIDFDALNTLDGVIVTWGDDSSPWYEILLAEFVLCLAEAPVHHYPLLSWLHGLATPSEATAPSQIIPVRISLETSRKARPHQQFLLDQPGAVRSHKGTELALWFLS